MPPPLDTSGSDKMSFNRIMRDDIADFVSMLIVQIYGKNSKVTQPVDQFPDCARKNGKEALATCLEAGLKSYNMIKRLLKQQKRRLRKVMEPAVYAKTVRCYGSSRQAAKYRKGRDAKLIEACATTTHYEAIATALLKEGLDSAKNQSLAPNTYYAMRNCIHKNKYHSVMCKRIERALKLKPMTVQNATRGHS